MRINEPEPPGWPPPAAGPPGWPAPPTAPPGWSQSPTAPPGWSQSPTAPPGWSSGPPGAPGWPAPPVSPVPPPPRRRGLGAAIVTGWVLVLLATGSWYALHGSATVREQTTIAQAEATVNRAAANLVAAAGPTSVAVVGGYVKTGACRLTPVRTGARYQRTVQIFTAIGAETALLDRLAARLPAGYHARIAGADPDTLDADAGDFVMVRATNDGGGQVRAVASTGCRPLGGNLPAPATVPAADQARIRSLFAVLKLTPAGWTATQVPCAGGTGVLRTVTASAAGPAQVGSLPARLRGAAWSTRDVLTGVDGSGTGRYAFLAGGAGFSVTAQPGKVLVTMTGGCPS